MTEYASLCFLSFNRPEFLREAIRTATAHAEYPHEVIVHDDGSGKETVDMLLGLLASDQISKLILSPRGHNEGVGAAFNRAAALATGDPVCKLDQDLVFQPGWLRKTSEWLSKDVDVGMFGLFKYYVDPVNWREMNHRPPSPELGGEYEYVDDFVGSAMVIPQEILAEFGQFPEHSAAFAEDVEYKKMLQANGLELALPCDDLATNVGFGVGPSTVVIAPSTVQTIVAEPLILSP